jgi:hypothetical protein
MKKELLALIFLALPILAASCAKPTEEVKDPSTLKNGTTYWKCSGIETGRTSFIELLPNTKSAEWNTSMTGKSYNPDVANAGSGKMIWSDDGHITFSDFIVYTGGDRLLMSNPPIHGAAQYKVESAEIQMTWVNSLIVTYRKCVGDKNALEPTWDETTTTVSFVQTDRATFMEKVFGQ